MRNRLAGVFLIITSTLFGQSEIFRKYQTAEGLIQTDNYEAAYTILKEIEPACDRNDTLYSSILWYAVGATTALEKQYRTSEKFDKSLQYGLEALVLIGKGKEYFDDTFASREFWMHKNVIVSYFGLGELDSASRHKKILYAAYKAKKLPDGLHEYFNFTFFKWDGKNVWGYEWYEDLPKDRFSKSFSKIVYFVYDTNPDGSDKDQLYRLHVLMFHNIDPSNKVDYVLTKRLEKAANEVSGTLYGYTYSENIDYVKLQADIREVLKGNYQPDTKSISKKK